MKAALIICMLIILGIIVAYTFIQPKGATPGPKTNLPNNMQIDQQIDSVISQEMDKTLANVNQADVEQFLLS